MKELMFFFKFYIIILYYNIIYNILLYFVQTWDRVHDLFKNVTKLVVSTNGI